MRYALLLLIATIAYGADEVFILTDGRTFTGTYDDEAGMLHTMAAGRPFDMRLATAQIASREWAKKGAAPAAAAKPSAPAAPAAMSAEAKAAATRDYAYQQKVREAESLDADAAKAKRDAESARKLSAKQLEHARNDWLAFCDRADLEGLGQNRSVIADRLIVLPRTKGNNRGSMDGLAESKQTAQKAIDLDALAAKKAEEAATARAAAEAMPHGDNAPTVASAPAGERFVAVERKPPMAPPPGAVADALKGLDADEADIKAQRAALDAREVEVAAKWCRALAMPLLPDPVLGADPRKSEIDRAADVKRANAAITAIKEAAASGDLAVMRNALHRADVRDGLAAYARLAADQ